MKTYEDTTMNEMMKVVFDEDITAAATDNIDNIVGDWQQSIENWKRSVDERLAEQAKKTPVVQQSFWETDIVVKDADPDVVIDPVKVFIAGDVKVKLTILMARFSRMEWLAYLIGQRNEDGSATVSDIIIPEQRVTPTNVFVKSGVDIPIIGVIHSHHDMGNFFSHTDDEYINMNHDISLCVTHKNITGQVRVKVDESTFVIAPAEVSILDNRWDNFIKEIEDNISVIAMTAAKVSGNMTVSKTSYTEVSTAKVGGDSFGARNIIGATNEYNRLLKTEPIDANELKDLMNILDNINDGKKLEPLMDEAFALFGEDMVSEEFETLVEEIDSLNNGEGWKPFEKKAMVRLRNNIEEILEKVQ